MAEGSFVEVAEVVDEHGIADPEVVTGDEGVVLVVAYFHHSWQITPC